MYKRKVSKLEEQVNKLRVFPCKISFIVDTAIKVEDASRKVDAVYIALPSKVKDEEKDIHQKSIDLINKYRTTMDDIDNVCDCKQRSSSPR